MRLGVSGKIFLAYTVLLLALAGNAGFAVHTLDRARQRVGANQALFELQVAADAAWYALNQVNQAAPERKHRTDWVLPSAFVAARERLDQAASIIDRYLDREPAAARRDLFARYRRDIASFRERTLLAAESFGTVQAGGDERANLEFASRLTNLVRGLQIMRTDLRNEITVVARELRTDEEDALLLALVLGVVGLIVAAGVGVAMLRTLRPLRVLRERAREVAGGSYARRTGVRSRDEIGDLAQEFDAMAGAIEERERRLIRSERLATVGRMSAQITHEIRNPLASIGLYAELLGDELADAGPEARRLAASIVSEVDRLAEITETYLRFARLPRPKLDREDLAAIVSSVMEFSRAELSQAGIALETAIEPGLPEVAADESQIRQALLNLCRNAREAMPGGGRLRIEVGAAPGGQVRVVVSDTGPGIAPEHIAKVFDPFFSTKEKGTGLGLALVHQIVAEHGGRVEARSRPGEGTSFTITLPALPPLEPSEVDPAKRVAPEDGELAAPVDRAPTKAG